MTVAEPDPPAGPPAGSSAPPPAATTTSADGVSPEPVADPDAPVPAVRTGAHVLEDDTRFGVPGLPVSRQHPFYVGFVGALGVLCAIALFRVLGNLASVFVLIVAALFIALGLDPLVGWLQRRGLSRGGAVAAVFLGVVAVFVGFVASVVPPLVEQGTQLANSLPDYVDGLLQLQWFQSLDEQYGIVSNLSSRIQSQLSQGTFVLDLFGGVLGAGVAVVSSLFSAFTVLVLTLYFLASLRTMTEAAYRLVPASRRERVRLLTDEIIRRVGGYVLGQVGVATINAVLTYVLVTVLDLPYGLVLAITVGLFGLIPLVGATIGAVVVVLVGLFDSLTTGIVITVYYVVYQQVENYVIAPRIMSRTVAVPGAVAVIAALAGGSLLGVLGALIAIPFAAGILLLVNEVLVPRQERH